MSNTPQQPADGWQPQQQPPVYRPNEQPPTEEPPPWSPESQRMSQPMSQPQSHPMSQPQQMSPQVPVEDVDGTVKYVGGPTGMPSQPQQYGPPPGVPVSPFDSPGQPQPGMPASDPFGGGGGMPVSGMPAPGMPPVSSIPASGMPVSAPGGQPPYGQPPFGGGQFGPQGGQLVPVSGGGAQPWGAPDAIKRKKKGGKGGGKGPMWLVLVGVLVIVVALGVGGVLIFQPFGGGGSEDPTGTIKTQEAGPVETDPVLVAGPGALRFVSSGPATTWAEGAAAPTVFSSATGIAAEDGTGSAYVGPLNADTFAITADSAIDDFAEAFDAAITTELLGGTPAEVATESYWIDGRSGQFRTYTGADAVVYVALVQAETGYEAFVGTAQPDQAELLESLRMSIRFGDL